MPTENILPARRRRRTQLACNPCRARKTGCDGHRPVCTSCRIKGLGDRCGYQEKAPSQKTLSLSNVNNRLQSLEAKVQGGLHLSQGAVDRSPTCETTSLAPVEQAMISRSHGVEEALYGPSSNIAFLQQTIPKTDTETEKQQPGQERTISDLLGFTAVQPHNSAHGLDPVPAPDHLAPSLLRCFFDSIHAVFPILHWPSFTATYNRLWRPNMVPTHQLSQTREDIVFQAILNMVMALGCQRSKQIPSVNRSRYADSFYKQSHRLVSIETLDFSSLEVVQLLLLRGIYLHYTTYADRCWNTIGVALRVAQGLELHLEQTTSSNSQLKREMRRRVWHSCVALDRLSATTFGRPVLHCRSYSVSFPEPIDDEYLSEVDEGHQPENSPSRIEFFRQSIKLFDILDETLTKFYSRGNQSLEQAETSLSSQYLGDVPRLCSKLDEFITGLPTHLDFGQNMEAAQSEPSSCFRMQAVILKSRVLYIRLLLLRPSLLLRGRRAVSNQVAINGKMTFSLLQEAYLREISRLCVSTAHDILAEMHRNISSRQQASPWHALFFTFGAASSLLAASLCPDLGVDLDLGPAKTSWDKALEVFENYKSQVESAEKGIEALKKYRQRFSAFTKEDQLINLPGYQVSGPNLHDDSQAVDENWLTGISEDFNDYFISDSLEESWLNSQDMGWGL